MSMFGKPKSAGGGITPEQLDQLVSDPELASSAAAIVTAINAAQSLTTADKSAILAAISTSTTSTLAAVNAAQSLTAADKDAILSAIAEHRSLTANTYNLVGTRADSLTNVVNTFRSALLDRLAAILNKGNALTLTGPDTTYALGNDVASIKTTVDTLLANPSAYSGKVDLVNRASGLANTGWTKAGGIGIPEGLFNTIRTAILPYTANGSAMTATTASTASYRATIGDKTYCLPYNYIQSYAFRVVDLGTGAWTTLSNIPAVTTSWYQSILGTVNGKLIATGNFTTLSGTYTPTGYTQTFDPSTGAWSLRATMPTPRINSGIADLTDGRCALFGGQTQTGGGATTTAANQSDAVSLYNEAANTWAAGTVLPVRMSTVRTARRGDGKVYLLPGNTSDGTTLVQTGRRVFLWSETGGTVECDPIPAECVATPWLMYVRSSDNCLVFVPYATPSSGLRARVLNPSAASGSQWSGIDWDYNDVTSYPPSPTSENKPTTSGYAMTGMMLGTSVYGLAATYVATQAAGWSQTFYQIKN